MPGFSAAHSSRMPPDGSRLKIFAAGLELADHVRLCVSARARRTGLLGKRSLPLQEGALLVIPPGRKGRAGISTSIHTIGMRFAIAVAWLAQDGEIVHVVLAPPWRPYLASPQPAWFVLEMHPGHLPALAVGLRLTWRLASGQPGMGSGRWTPQGPAMAGKEKGAQP